MPIKHLPSFSLPLPQPNQNQTCKNNAIKKIVWIVFVNTVAESMTYFTLYRIPLWHRHNAHDHDVVKIICTINNIKLQFIYNVKIQLTMYYNYLSEGELYKILLIYCHHKFIQDTLVGVFLKCMCQENLEISRYNSS